MKGRKIGLALAVACAIASAPALADRGRDNDNSGGHRDARVFDICVNGIDGAKLTNFPPAPGDRVTAVGMILPANTVPSDGSGDATCAAYQNLKIGTFFVNGTFVSGFDPDGIKLPQAADDDLGYVDWHFRIDHRGAFDTTGPIKQFVQGGSYPQTITGGTGRFKGVKGRMITTMLGAGGFQIRVALPK